ncbi:MAG: nitrogen regulation protein NR(II) [Gammaproteobacteria bacterium]|nr:nitrogen regulation protein NR(II) [Gammaproteobacteria bacterium]MBU1656207.1 nitrogen regulation protein NR(II) [Gammaproteobacteria bacterium]MBU1959772.1 nitrogen regulation protein NR(II) [Gammaproteobacteria bacterium]
MNKLEQKILEYLNTVVLLFDRNMRLRYINPSGEILLGSSARNLLGQLADQLVRCPQGISNDRLRKAMETGQAFTERVVTVHLPEGREATVDCTAIPLQDKEGEPGLLLELQQTDRQLRISREEQLIAQIKATAAVVRNLAHEIKNPLGGVRGAAQLLQCELIADEQKEYTQVIIEEADRLQTLVNRMLGPNKMPSMDRINVHQVLERVRHLLLAERGKTIIVIRDYDPSLPEIWADANQLIQALLNIGSNAAKAISEKGTIIFRTRIQRQHTIGNKRHKLAIQIDIQDDGPGIPKEIEDKIFFPMVSGRDDGVGLGLSIAQSLINQHGGLIECESQPGKTLFSVLLPLDSLS